MPSLCPMGFSRGRASSNSRSASSPAPVANRSHDSSANASPMVSSAQSSSGGVGQDLSAVRSKLQAKLRCPGYDDGSLAPLLIRFAWHCCGTYDSEKRTGGSNGGTMRFPTEQADPENAGLDRAREAVMDVHRQHPELSFADIAVLAGYVAFEATGGPVIPFATGREDLSEDRARSLYGSSLCPYGDGVHNPGGSRLPAADLGPDTKCPLKAPKHEREKPTIDAVRGTFQRMSLDDKETVLLIIMGHQYGRMHPEVSGFEEPWYAFDPTHWNVYGPGGLGYLSTYAMQARNGLNPEEPNSKGKRQFNMRLGGGVFAMIAVDMALLWDPSYKKLTLWYDRHRTDFHRDSAAAWKKLTELGCDGLLTPEVTPGHDHIRIDHMM